MILCTNSVEESIGLVFTNYDIAYVGKQFSQSFLKWIDSFSHDILNAYSTSTRRHRGSVVSISSLFYHMANGEIVMYITNISFNPIQLAIVRGNTFAERSNAGMVTTPPTLIATRRSMNDYSYYGDGGTYHGHPVSIVKNKRSSKDKPRFNYYDTVTRNIMFDYEFYSAFPFENNKANAWATDGHKYLLPLMLFIESKIRHNIITNKTYNTMSTKKRIRLTESQLRNIIKQTLKESMNNEDITSFGNSMKQRYNHSSRKDWDSKKRWKDMFKTFSERSLETQKLIDGLIDNIYMYESVCSTRMNRSFFWEYYDVLKKMRKDFSLDGPVMMTLANWYNGVDDYWDKHNTDDDNYETEDWYERNEHGDFDTY